MTDWSDHEALRDALLAELTAAMPGEMQPGDITAADVAEAAGISIHAAEYRLSKLVDEGKLVTEKVTMPGSRLAQRVWRKAT